ncbi:tetratricopeptide repeat protein [Dyadobacter sp. CY323]|uniref:tetratricopeptide repeat protein n=1 Tax=Dyadobacter sp. CY323 TaxID=2907302 RepID=UPI001F33B240|nr:tetratricopeptide repeat protein [Dyadobacter sp. CY323]MCE6992785.1 tetratricopeptide repeat protein [Dyadobacter sp. CY323]
MKRHLFLRRMGLLLVGWAFLITVTHAQVDSLLRLSPSQQIFHLWQNAPYLDIINPPHLTARDSTAMFIRLDRLGDFAREKGDDRLYWSAQLHKILVSHTLLDVAGKKSTVLEEAQPLMDQCPVPVVQASYWYYRGRFDFGKKRFDAGFHWLLRAQNAFERIGYENIPEIHEYLSGLGGRYYFFGEYQTCIRYMKAALRYPNVNKHSPLIIHNTIGLCYRQLGDYQNAQAFFSRGRALAASRNDTTHLAITSTNVGHVLLLTGKPRQALPYLYQAYSLSQTRVPENAALTAIYLAKALLALDSTQKARAYLDGSTRFYKNQHWSDYDLHYYQARTLYYRKTGNYRYTTAYLDSSLRLQDTLRARFNSRLLAASQMQVNAERYLNNTRQLESEKASAEKVRNIILLAMLLLTGSGIYSLRQNQQKRLLEKRALLSQQQQAEALLAQYMANLHEKNQLIETISADLDQANLRTHPPTIETLLDRVILTEIDWQQFKQLFEAVYPAFLTSLQQRFADLTPAEIRLIALLKLGVSTKQMANMLGVTMNTIRTSRYRLRRKLERHQLDTNLDSLIRQL